MGWNDLAFLSGGFFFLFFSFFWFLELKEGEWDGNLFFLAATERKGKKENRTQRNRTRIRR